MSINAIVSGTVSKASITATTKTGNPWVRLSMRVQLGELTEFVSVAAFAESAVDALRDVVEGQSLAVEGVLAIREWTATDGQPRRGLAIVVTRVMVLEATKPKARPRSPRASPATRPAPSLDPFDAEAGDLEGHLPPARYPFS
jgi:single-stranded DNA-binding protein